MNTLGHDLVVQIEALTRESYSARAIGRTLGINRHTVLRHQRALGLVDLKCECGKPIKHKGFCSVRFARAPERQKWMQNWHPKSVFEIEEALARPDEPTYFGS